MATNVNAAFREFQGNSVDLDSSETKSARGSRDWLVERIHEFPDKDSEFPLLYVEKDIYFGSFSRRTKIRPLDDIDLISCLHATGGTYIAHQHDDVRITVPDSSRLKRFRHDSSDELNSRKVLNKFVGALEGIHQYRRAEVNRRGEAATLQLASYPWNFDVVPAFFTSEEFDGRTYYLIPNGEGHWKKADPRVDRDRVSRVNQMHSGRMLSVLRCVKFWQRRQTMPSMGSYLLETIVVNHFEAAIVSCSEFVDLELPAAFRSIARAILGPVHDPKRIQSDINDVNWDDRFAIQARAEEDAAKAELARELEKAGDMKGAIAKWREVFGSEFPAYG